MRMGRPTHSQTVSPVFCAENLKEFDGYTLTLCEVTNPDPIRRSAGGTAVGHPSITAGDPARRRARHLGPRTEMRIALAPSGQIGLRAGRVILADGRVTAVGALGTDVHSRDSRVEPIDSPEGWDLLVSDASPDDARLAAAVAAGVPIISSLGDPQAFPDAAHFVSGASVERGLPASLAVQAMDQLDVVTGVSTAITTEGKPLARGTAVSFPGSIGPLWAEVSALPASWPNDWRFLNAPYDGALAGVSVSVEGEVDGSSRIVSQAIVDDPRFLGAIALAAAALMLIDESLPKGGNEVHRFAERYIEACTVAGMGVASFSPAS